MTKRDAAAQPFDKLLTNTGRHDTPQPLPRFQISHAHADAAKAETAQPKRLDELVKQKADGWRKILTESVGEALPSPSTTREAHDVMRDAVKRYSLWRFEQRYGKQ
jgi:hypothetical protein